MSDLYSTTSRIEQDHTALTEALSRAELISCTRLRALAFVAMDSYVKHSTTQGDDVLERVRQYGVGVIGATAEAVDYYVDSDDIPEDAPTVEDGLVPLRLLTYRDTDSKIDMAIKSILESMPSATTVENPDLNSTTWLFRIATKFPHINLIAHVTRQDWRSLGLIGMHHVTYKQSFGAFEVEPSLAD